MDFANAFDKVSHRRLSHKLDYYGIRGSTHKWINSWLSWRTQQLVLDGQASAPVPVLSGVSLGPILFVIFINNLSDNIGSSVRGRLCSVKNESKHYVTNQYHPKHYHLYPKAGKYSGWQ